MRRRVDPANCSARRPTVRRSSSRRGFTFRLLARSRPWPARSRGRRTVFRGRRPYKARGTGRMRGPASSSAPPTPRPRRACAKSLMPCYIPTAWESPGDTYPTTGTSRSGSRRSTSSGCTPRLATAPRPRCEPPGRNGCQRQCKTNGDGWVCRLQSASAGDPTPIFTPARASLKATL